MGDLAGLRHRLPYLADLGVDALWITPFYPSPMVDARLRRRRLPRGVDPLFGDLADFDALVARRARAGPPGDRGRGPQPHLRPAPLVPGRAGGAAGSPGAGPLPLPGRPGPGGERAAERLAVASSAARPGPGSSRTAEWYLHLSRPSSPTSTGTHPRCGRTPRRCCASGWTAAWTASASTSRTALVKDAGPAATTGRAPAGHRARRGDQPAWDQHGDARVYRSLAGGPRRVPGRPDGVAEA